MADVFNDLFKINVNDHTEERDGLTYLTWSWAWAEVKKRYPDATYTIWRDENNLPYVYDPLTGYMVFTTVTIEGITHEMWLPVMGTGKKAMKAEPYTVRTRRGEFTVEAATMFDINTAIMRCLTKNLAVFGLGLYVYAGSDLPEPEKVPEDTENPPKKEEKKAEKKAEKVVVNYPDDKKAEKKVEKKPEKVAEKKSKIETIDGCLTQDQIIELNDLLVNGFPKNVRLNVYGSVIEEFGASSFSRIPVEKFDDVKRRILERQNKDAV